MPALARDSCDGIRFWIDRAIEVDAPAVSLMFNDLAESRPSQDNWSRLFELLDCIELPLFIENNSDLSYRFGNSWQIGYLLENVPSLKLELDLGHLACSGQLQFDLTSISNRIVSIHVHDNDGLKDLHLPLGLGTAFGSYTVGIEKLLFLPEVVVIETDPHCGCDAKAWTSALRADRAHLRMSLRQLFPV
jgi:sugar phosphate isomerase/epimerase